MTKSEKKKLDGVNNHFDNVLYAPLNRAHCNLSNALFCFRQYKNDDCDIFDL